MRIEQPIQINLGTAGQTAVLQKFAGLKSGDAVSVQVLSLEGNKLFIQLPGGEKLKADFRGQLSFLPGDQLDLALASRSNGVASFRLRSVNGQPLRMDVSESENALLRSGIEPTRQNLAASRILQQSGYAPTPQTLSNLSRIMQENPQMPENVSAFFAANNIEPEPETVRILTQIQEEPSWLGNRTEALAAELKRLFPSEAAEQPANMPLLSKEAPVPQPSAPQKSGEFTAFVLQTLRDQPQAAQAITQTERFPVLVKQLASLPPNEAKSSISTFVASLHLNPAQEKAAITALQTAYAQSIPQTGKEPPQPESQPEQKPPPGQNPLIGQEQQPGQIQRHGQETQPGQEPLTRQEPQQKPADAAGLADTSKLQPSKTVVSTGSPDVQDPQPLKALFQKLNEFFATIRPEDNASTAESLENAVHKQEKLAQDVESAISSLAGEKHPITRQAAEMHSQINLNSGLENFYYYQIPIQFREQKSTAELYVFERNRRPGETREDCTILIALDTQNMGRCETILRADGGKLDIRLRLSSQSACSFAEANASQLRSTLAEEGFQVKSLAFEVLQEKTTPLNAQSVFAGLSSFAPGALNIQV